MAKLAPASGPTDQPPVREQPCTSGQPSTSGADKGFFPETSWTLIERIVSGEDKLGRLALGELLKRYEHVIRRLVERRGPVYGMTADDMHQEFLLHLATPLKNGNSRLSGLDPVNGRFRYWLSKTVANRVSNLRRQAIAQRLDRTHSFGSDVPECCDVVGQEVFPLPSDLEDDLALAEAQSYCDEAMRRLQEKEPEARFEELRPYLSTVNVAETRGEASQRLGMRENTLTKNISRLRSRFIRELTKLTAERLGSALPDPCLDPTIQKERERIVHLLVTHPWAPKAEPTPPTPHC